MRTLLGGLATATLLALMACGGQDSGTGGAGGAEGGDMGGEMGGVSAGATGSGAAAGEAAEAGSQLSATGQSCLGLVGDGRFAEAVDVCTRALRESPTSQELKDALATAQREVAASGEAAAASAKQAAGEAGAEVDSAREAAKGLVP